MNNFVIESMRDNRQRNAERLRAESTAVNANAKAESYDERGMRQLRERAAAKGYASVRDYMFAVLTANKGNWHQSQMNEKAGNPVLWWDAWHQWSKKPIFYKEVI